MEEVGHLQRQSQTTPDYASDRAYEVFLNFRGPDSRYTVTDILYRRLTKAGIRVFLDDEEMRKGEVIEGELLAAITNSRFCIPIFSKDYASSKWCLRELAKMIECWETSSSSGTKKVILPIFYDVDVSDVKLRSQVYLTPLQNHKELGEDVKPWEEALRKVATIKGWNLKDHGLGELADLITKEVFSKLTASEAVTGLPDHLVGIDKPIEDIMKLLEEGSPGVRFIVIHGMGGIGKTTLADAVFKKFSSRYQGKCFLKDIRRSTSADDMVKLQEKLLLDTLDLNTIKVSDVDDGICKIGRRLRDKNVLIVLDDVNKRDHLLKLAAKSFWFGIKSRIIITTRNIEFLPTKGNKEYYFYEVEKMDRRHALQLFCQHAFEMDEPPPEFYDRSTDIVDTTGGLPLSLQVTGSSLYNQDNETWKFRLEKLKEAPHEDVQATLMISYQALEYEPQQIFLDIACFFNCEKMTYPLYFWEACKLYPDNGIKILMRRSLIKVLDYDQLWMHDQLRDFGRAIAQPQRPCLESHFLKKPSRLWSPECALDALQSQEVDESITAIKLGTLDANYRFEPEEFARAKNLKFLQLEGGNFEGDFKNVLRQLRWLSWFACPLRFETTNLSFKNLVILKLESSQIDEDWGGWGVFMESKHLKVLHLENCERLQRSPNFSIGDLKSLEVLKIYNTGLIELHASIGKLMMLVELDLSYSKIKELPDSIGDLKCLNILRMKRSSIEYLPDTIGRLESLAELNLYGSNIILLPETIGCLERLKVINVSLTQIRMLPMTIVNLGNLERLEAESCQEMDGNLPEEIGKLSRLRILNLRNVPMSRMPTTFNQLSHLQQLSLHGIREPQELSKLPTSLISLSVISSSLNLHQLPDLSSMTNLVSLTLDSESKYWNLSPCNQTYQMKWLARLTKLEDLKLDLPDLVLPPNEVSSLSRLQSLRINCFDLQSLPHLPSSLDELGVKYVKSPIDWQRLSSLNNLSTLFFLDCQLEKIKVDCIEHLHVLCFIGCKFLKSLSNLSCLKKLERLSLVDCPRLVDIDGPGKLKALQTLSLLDCNNIEWLPDVDEEVLCHILGCDYFYNYQGPFRGCRGVDMRPLYYN